LFAWRAPRLTLPALLLGALASCAASNPEFDEPEAGVTDAPPLPGARQVDGPLIPTDASAAAIDLSTGLIGYWRMDEPANATVARDSSGLHHDGTLEGLPPASAWIPGRFGSALHFPEDKNVGVRVQLTTRIAGVRRYTLAAWARRGRPRPVAYQSLISRQLGTGITEVFDMSVSKDLLQAYAPDRTAQGVSSAMVNRPAPVNTWFHAAATFDGQTIRIYQDGVLENSLRWTGGLPSSDQPLYLGTNKNESGASTAHHPWEGDLDEVLLYDVALPAQAIAALAAGQRPAVP
jgi:hypothetical protein